MLIKDIKQKHGEIFSGSYRVINPSKRLSKQGVPFQVCQLTDMSGDIPAFLWLENVVEPPLLVNDTYIEITGVLRVKEQKCTATIRSMKILESKDDPIWMIPSTWCNNENLLQRLQKIWGSLEIEPLKKFMNSVLSTKDICKKFVTVPASIEHHHAYEHGMLEHALECAEIVKAIPLLENHVRELAVIAALLHDIGKIKTMTEHRGFSDTGYVLHHDLITLEILAPFLCELDKEWPNGGIGLRYLLSWRNVPFRPASPLIAAAEAIIAADRLSCAVNIEKKAFAGRPDWHRSAKLSSTNRCWRPALPRQINNNEQSRCISIREEANKFI